MKTSLRGTYRRKLEALRRAYAESLAEKVRALEEVAALLAARRFDPDLADEALHLAHRLRGSSAIYGFSDVSRAAGDLEESLRAFTGCTPTPEEVRARLASPLEALRHALPE